MTTAKDIFRFSSWKQLSWRHPEWWVVCVCVVAWFFMLSRDLGVGLDAASHAHAAHAGVMSTHSHAQQPGLPTNLFWWLVMVAAMMFPMIIEPIRTTAGRSLWRRRHRAIAGFVIGYSIAWMVFGLAALTVTNVVGLQTQLQPNLLAALGFSAALLWQITPARRRSVMACHRTRPLAPNGWLADRDCMFYGWTIGLSCLVTCWALMLACMFAGHSIPALLAVTSIGWIERNKRRPKQLALCAAIGGLILISLIAPHA